jgi:RNA polymerase sigma-32 factor
MRMGMIEEDDPQRATRKFARQAMAAPLLSVEEEGRLARLWRDERDEDALHGLISAHIRLVVAKAARFRGYGLPPSDLVQEGNVGLMQAAMRFDPERGVRFSTYAAWWIRAAIQDYVLRNWSIVRTGSTAVQKTLFFSLRRLRAQIGDENTAESEICSRIAESLGAPLREVEAMSSRLSGPDRSLNAPVAADTESALQDLLADEGPTPDDEVLERHDGARRVKLVADALGALDPRERMIIENRRLGDEPLTLEALGTVLGVSKERVRQIEAKAMDKMRKTVMRAVGDPFEAGYV